MRKEKRENNNWYKNSGYMRPNLMMNKVVNPNFPRLSTASLSHMPGLLRHSQAIVSPKAMAENSVDAENLLLPCAFSQQQCVILFHQGEPPPPQTTAEPV